MLTLSDKEQLIKDLIKEGRNTTIRDYVEVLAEIEGVIPATNETHFNHIANAVPNIIE
jgi:hypothetical protein